MSRNVKRAAVIFVMAIAAAQLIRPERVNPPTDARRTIGVQMGTASGLATVLDRSCGDCHSNGTVWPWYSNVAPTSWLMAYGVRAGRQAINFSEWDSYSPEQHRALLSRSCSDASTGKMPGVYTWLRPDTKLSAADIATICAASQAQQSARNR